MSVSAKEVVAHQRRRRAERQQHGLARAQRFLDRLPAASRMLRERYAAGRVWLFGSMAAGKPLPSSDIDLAVEGLAPEQYFAALADLMQLFDGRVDLVLLEDAPPTLVERVLAEGRLQ